MFPGAAWGVLHKGTVLAIHACGGFTFSPQSPRITPDTSFDLASVTKVLATTGVAMLLWQRGTLALDSLLGDLLPAFVIGAAAGQGQWRRRVTVRNLLAHNSGLPAHAAFFETCRSPGEILRAALRLPLTGAPGEQSAYSDPGFLLLGKALEVVAGEPLDRFCRREVFVPLGMARTRFCPPAAERGQIPPTEEDPVFRHRVVQGEVHDENAFALGGVSGHAGLFAPVGDVLSFAEATLAPLRAGGAAALFSPEAVRLFTSRVNIPPGSSRALGWDTPSGSPSSSGDFFSPLSFGHLGYTGTSLWIDPVEDLAVVLLTNRTFPTRENKKIQELRPRFHNSVVDQL